VAAIEDRLRALRQGLSDAGFQEGNNLVVEYRWGQNQLDRLPALAHELVSVGVSVIVTSSHEAAFAAKAATASIPVVFIAAEDPVQLGLVTSLARPTGNLTGINFLGNELTGKRLDLLCQLLPKATRVAILVSSTSVTNTQVTIRDAKAAAPALGLQIQIVDANSIDEIDAAFASLERDRPDALYVDLMPFFSSRRVQIVQLASKLRLPAIYGQRQFAEAGGLVTYGADISETWRQAGTYAARILKGAKVGELPVIQSSKFEFVINVATARALGLIIPPTLLARADEVIE
jgi:putative ABC transport system substrate-binding protein